VTSMERMFSAFFGSWGRRPMTFNAEIGAWDTSSVTDMSRMFYEATQFNSDISAWDTSSVTDMRAMFWKARSLQQDLSAWDCRALRVQHGHPAGPMEAWASMFSEADAFHAREDFIPVALRSVPRRRSDGVQSLGFPGVQGE